MTALSTRPDPEDVPVASLPFSASGGIDLYLRSMSRNVVLDVVVVRRPAHLARHDGFN